MYVLVLLKAGTLGQRFPHWQMHSIVQDKVITLKWSGVSLMMAEGQRFYGLDTEWVN